MHFAKESQLSENYRKELCKIKAHCYCQEIIEINLSSGSIPITLIDCKPEKQCIGTILIIQGRAETLDKYLSLIYDFTNKGYRVITYDQPFQGYSSNLKDLHVSWIGSFDDYLKVLSAILNRFHTLTPYVIAVSMGGMIAIQALNKEILQVPKIVLVTPMIRIAKKGLPNILARAISKIMDLSYRILGLKYAPALGQKAKYIKPNFENNQKTHSKARLDFYHKWYDNPELHPLGGVSWHWLYECYKNEPQYINCKKTQILFLEAGCDYIVDNSFNKKLIENSFNNITFYRINESFHDLLNESDTIRNYALSYICKFLEIE